MKVVEENFSQLLQNLLCLWHKEIFVYIDEDFAINWICPKFLSIMMTGKIRKGMTESGSFKNYSEAVHIPFFKGCALHKIPCICRINLKQVHL